MAFHLRPQIASELGRKLTRSSNPHRNHKRFASGNGILALWPQIQIAAGLNPPRSTRPYLRWSEHPKSQAAGRGHRILAAKQPQNRRIASPKATKEASDNDLCQRGQHIVLGFLQGSCVQVPVEDGAVHGQDGVDLSMFRACQLAFGDTCSPCLVFTSISGAHKGA